ncbi:hypothetical protein EVAR_74770_1 [Eumeta japonica]|uniref:Uncharacterized protein n=1 Tax=Eumeta variegata TaxID=151549 RepID=A0A4C1SP34_EUMVA|nr:hypothetical protein EVAR_74770_1 [Eumeta japonica]
MTTTNRMSQRRKPSYEAEGRLGRAGELAVITVAHEPGPENDTLEADVPPYSTVARWCAEFKGGRTYTDPRSDRPTTVVTEEIV